MGGGGKSGGGGGGQGSSGKVEWPKYLQQTHNMILTGSSNDQKYQGSSHKEVHNFILERGNAMRLLYQLWDRSPYWRPATDDKGNVVMKMISLYDPATDLEIVKDNGTTLDTAVNDAFAVDATTKVADPSELYSKAKSDVITTFGSTVPFGFDTYNSEIQPGTGSSSQALSASEWTALFGQIFDGAAPTSFVSDYLRSPIVDEIISRAASIDAEGNAWINLFTTASTKAAAVSGKDSVADQAVSDLLGMASQFSSLIDAAVAKAATASGLSEVDGVIADLLSETSQWDTFWTSAVAKADSVYGQSDIAGAVSAFSERQQEQVDAELARLDSMNSISGSWGSSGHWLARSGVIKRHLDEVSRFNREMTLEVEKIRAQLIPQLVDAQRMEWQARRDTLQQVALQIKNTHATLVAQLSELALRESQARDDIKKTVGLEIRRMNSQLVQAFTEQLVNDFSTRCQEHRALIGLSQDNANAVAGYVQYALTQAKNALDSSLNRRLEMAKAKYAHYLQQFQDSLKYRALAIDAMRANALYKVDQSKLTIATLNENENKKLDVAVKGYNWRFGLLQQTSNILASVQGAVVQQPDSVTRQDGGFGAVMGGALGGASAFGALGESLGKSGTAWGAAGAILGGIGGALMN